MDVHPDIERVIVSKEEIQARVNELAAQVSADYADNGQLVIVGILKGAFVFLADLARRLTVPHRVDLWPFPATARRRRLPARCASSWICEWTSKAGTC